jgi:hypothetical protein
MLPAPIGWAAHRPSRSSYWPSCLLPITPPTTLGPSLIFTGQWLGWWSLS